MKIIRRIQPDVMFRCRGIGNYGDYYTPEGFVPGAKANTDMPWMVIYPLAGEGIWAYEPDASKYKDGHWIITNLVDTVAKGGNFMVGIGPDDQGQFHPKAIAALQYAGAWLKTNGEAIFNTHPLPGDGWKDGDNLRFTHSDLGPIIYAIALQWPGEELVLHKVKLTPGATVRMLGTSESLPWRHLPTGGRSSACRPAGSRLPTVPANSLVSLNWIANKNKPICELYEYQVPFGDPRPGIAFLWSGLRDELSTPDQQHESAHSGGSKPGSIFDGGGCASFPDCESFVV